MKDLLGKEMKVGDKCAAPFSDRFNGEPKLEIVEISYIHYEDIGAGYTIQITTESDEVRRYMPHTLIKVADKE